jgi:uncharacterized BrkB/YihY/UPF0761 family membrane protein
VVTVLWEITSAAFPWYIASGLVYYDLLYGSLTVITVHMLWFYLNSQILLFGAYLSSAIAQSSQRWVVTIPGKEESRNNAILKQDPPVRDRPQRKA